MDMSSDSMYKEGTALIAVSGVFLGLGAVFFLYVVWDIVWRKGWKSMMWIMIPVYPINAGYLGPLAIYLYLKYGRAKGPSLFSKSRSKDEEAHPKDVESHHHEQHNHQGGESINGTSPADAHNHHMGSNEHGNQSLKSQEDHEQHSHNEGMHTEHATTAHHGDHAHHAMPDATNNITTEAPAKHEHHMEGHDMPMNQHMHHSMEDPNRPFWATVLIGVMHCGSGCVLGDLVGEWLVYGAEPKINGQDIWPELLIDYGFALLFGIVFQYFSIAPMSGEYGPKTLWRAAKADILSLTAFEIGLFGWMVAYQVGIWNYNLPMDSWTYWFMMQVGMFFGYCTSVPVNWWLLKKGIKEPCV